MIAQLAEMTYLEAIARAIHAEMSRDARVCLYGMANHTHVSNLQLARSFLTEFGDQRVIESTPLEQTIIGAASGLALMGLRPLVTLPDNAHLGATFDQIVEIAAMMSWRSGDTLHVPMVIRIPYSTLTTDRWNASNDATRLAQVPGLKVVIPSTPYDALGLMRAAIRDDDPVLFLEEPYLYHRLREEVPPEEYTLPLGLAETRSEGEHLTVLTYGAMVYPVLEASETVAAQTGYTAEIIDLRSLAPLDMEAIRDAVARTNRVLIAAPPGAGAELAAVLARDMIDMLDAPILRISAPDQLVETMMQLVRQ